MLRPSLLFLLVCHLAMATPVSNNQAIVISCLPDNPIISWMKRVALNAYSDIGFKVVFKEYPAKRGLTEANAGNVDAVLVRSELIEANLPDYIRVPVVLGKGDLVLYCQLSVPCSEAVLDDNRNLIGTISGSVASAQYMENKNASSYEVPRDSQISQMFQVSRLDYILSIDVENYGNYSQIAHTQYQRVVLESFEAFHYLHKSKVDILPQLTQSILKAKQQAAQDFPLLKQ